MATEIVGFEIDSDEVVGRAGGFLGIRRMRLRNRRADGTLSEQFLCDFVVRPVGLDAVVVTLYHRGAAGPRVLLRKGLRPPLAFGRQSGNVPMADRRSYLFFTELVAGIIEEGDLGVEGVCRRAADEAFEEAGYRVVADAVKLLGAPMFVSPGAIPERLWFTVVEVADPAAQLPLDGDGSPMEEGASTEWMGLDEAIAACERGEIEDGKTELALRRLRDFLATKPG